MGKHKILPKRLDYLDVNDAACQFRINVDVFRAGEISLSFAEQHGD